MTTSGQDLWRPATQSLRVMQEISYKTLSHFIFLSILKQNHLFHELWLSRVLWLRGRASDSRLREPGFKPCVTMLKPWASFFTLHCYSSLSCINKYLAIDSGGDVYKQPSCINCSIRLDASQRSWDGVWLNKSAREVKCKAPQAILRTGYCTI